MDRCSFCVVHIASVRYNTEQELQNVHTHSPFYTFRASIGLVRPIFVALFKASTVDHKIEGSRNIQHGETLEGSRMIYLLHHRYRSFWNLEAFSGTFQIKMMGISDVPELIQCFCNLKQSQSFVCKKT